MADLSDQNLNQTAQALEQTVDNAASGHLEDPKSHIQAPSKLTSTYNWLMSYFPQNYLESLEANWHLGNYVIDRKTGQKSFEEMSIYVRLGMHLLYYGSRQEQLLQLQRVKQLLLDQSLKMGSEYDAPESKAHIVPFIQSFNLQSTLIQLKQPDPSKYATFNEFFGRELRPDARPVDEPTNPRVVSSPADCRLTAFPTIDQATKYWIKGFGFSLSKLLGDDGLAQQFDAGSMVIARLAPQDYHRWHSPVDGTVKSITNIAGTYYTVNPQAINEAGTMDVFCENRRSVMLLERAETKAPVAVVAVGAMLVGSIKYVDGVDQPGAVVKRGQCLGAFYYGGSTVIVLYPKGEITLDSDLVKNSTVQNCETLMAVGNRCGEGP